MQTKSSSYQISVKCKVNVGGVDVSRTGFSISVPKTQYSVCRLDLDL